ncbi:MAG: 6-pyruvoyl-tetrahydropterin synthase-related protein [Candidatus Hodarchaeales archaeon]
MNDQNFRYHFHQGIRILPSMIQEHLLDISVISWLFLMWIFSSLGEMPSGTDTTIHYFKASQTRDFLAKGIWPSWTFQTQGGAPFLSTYPPFYYLLVAAVSFITGSIGLSMKIIALLALFGLFLSFSLLGRVISGYHDQTAVAIFCFAMSVMYSMVGQQSFILSVLFALLSILCFLIAVPSFKYPVKSDNSVQRAVFLLVLSPLFFSLTILTHLVTAYMLGVFWMIIIVYHLFNIQQKKAKLYEIVPPFYTAVTGVFLSAIWFFPALLEYFYQDRFKVTILQQIFWQDDMMIIVALLSVSPLFLVLISALKDEKNDQTRILIIAMTVFIILGLGKYSPFQLIPLFKSLLPGRVLVFAILTGSLLVKSSKKNSRVALVLLVVISSASFVYYANPSILGILGIKTEQWRNSGLETMAEDGSLFGNIPADFLEAMESLRDEKDDSRVIYFSVSPTLSPLMQHYRLLFLSGHGTVQGDYPDSSEDIKWTEYTSVLDNPFYYYKWPNITDYLTIGNVGWLIYKPITGLKFPESLNSYFSIHTVHGDYEVWKSISAPAGIFGKNGTVNATVSRDSNSCKITIDVVSTNCTTVTVSETFHPRWLAKDQNNRVLTVSKNEFGFMDIDIGDSRGLITLELKPVNGILPSTVITLITLIILPSAVLINDKVEFKRFIAGKEQLKE